MMKLLRYNEYYHIIYYMDKIGTSVFRSFFISYLFVMIVQLIAFIFIYYYFNNEMSRRAEESVTLALESGRNLIESRIEEIEESGQRILGDPDIERFSRIESPMETSDFFLLWDLQNKFHRFNLKTTFARSVYLIFRESGAVVSNVYANPDIVWFYKYFLKYNELDYPQWVQSINLWSAETEFLKVTEIGASQGIERSLTLKIPLLLEATQPKTVMVVLIPEESIIPYFDFIVREKGEFVIAHEDGTILLEYRQSVRDKYFNSAHYIEVKIGGIASPFIYTAKVPRSYVVTQVRPVQIVFIIIFAISILAYLIISGILAFKQSKPYSRMYGLVASASGVDTASIQFHHEWLEDSIKDLIGERVNIENALERRRVFIQNGLFDRLLHGGFNEIDEIEDYTRDLDITFPITLLSVKILAVRPRSDFSDIKVIEALTHDYLLSQKKADWFIHKVHEGDVIISPDNPDNITRLQAMQQELIKSFDLPTILAIGKERTELIDLYGSFTEAQMALKIGPVRPDKATTVEYTSLYDLPGSYSFDQKVANSFVNQVLSGDFNKAKDTLMELRKKNFVEMHLSTISSYNLIADISLKVNRIVDSSDTAGHDLPDNYIRYLERFTSFDDYFNRVLMIIEVISNGKNNSKRSHNRVLIDEIISFLEKNYSDTQISLSSVAHKFSMNQNYLSRLFKEQKGSSFSAVLEQIRMDEVLRMMIETRLNLMQISKCTGYLSWNSFYKAFRRLYGTSPGVYRDNLKENIAEVL